MKKIPKAYGAFLIPALTAFFMSGVISLTLSVISQGVSLVVLQAWATHAFPMAYGIALPTIFVVLPLVRYIVYRITA